MVTFGKLYYIFLIPFCMFNILCYSNHFFFFSFFLINTVYKNTDINEYISIRPAVYMFS